MLFHIELVNLSVAQPLEFAAELAAELVIQC